MMPTIRALYRDCALFDAAAFDSQDIETYRAARAERDRLRRLAATVDDGEEVFVAFVMYWDHGGPRPRLVNVDNLETIGVDYEAVAVDSKVVAVGRSKRVA